MTEAYCQACGLEQDSNFQHPVACPDDCGAHDFRPQQVVPRQAEPKVRFCKDCRWYSWWGLYTSNCNAPEASRDVVRGGPTFCGTERLVHNMCGPFGKLWERKLTWREQLHRWWVDS